MTHYFDDTALQAFAAAQAEIMEAQGRADRFARSELDAASAHLSSLVDGQSRLGGVPTPDAYPDAAAWRVAEDQHTFATRRYSNEIREAQQALDAARIEHGLMLAVMPGLKREYLRAVLKALDTAIIVRIEDTARIATVRQSLLNRIPRDEWHALVDLPVLPGPQYKVATQGYADMSIFQASAPGDGIGPDKSAALVAELGIL